MTDNSIPVDEIEEPAGKAKNEWTEEMSVAGGRLVETIQELLREAVVRKIVVRDKDGKTLLEIPLYAGVLGVAVLGYWSVLALIAAWFTEVSILIVREGLPDEPRKTDKEAAADAKAAADAAAASVNEMAGKAGSAFSDVIYRASKAASDLAARAADAMEGSAVATNGNGTAKTAEAPPAPEPAAAKETAAEPQRCQAITKAGTQCKRNALEGSDFCSIHTPD